MFICEPRWNLACWRLSYRCVNVLDGSLGYRFAKSTRLFTILTSMVTFCPEFYMFPRYWILNVRKDKCIFSNISGNAFLGSSCVPDHPSIPVDSRNIHRIKKQNYVLKISDYRTHSSRWDFFFYSCQIALQL